MKRLQDDLGTALFRRRGRGLALTEAGEIALGYARRVLALNDELLDTMQGANLAGQMRVGRMMIRRLSLLAVLLAVALSAARCIPLRVLSVLLR